MTKDLITSFLRAPFTTYEGPAGPGEVNEKPRGTGFRRAIGELLSCPFCFGQWVAAFLMYGLVLRPALTRLIAAIFAVLTLADLLHYGSEALKKGAGESE